MSCPQTLVWTAENAHRPHPYWEAEKVVVVTSGVFGFPGVDSTVEMATRAKTHLILILAEAEREDENKYYAGYQKNFQAAADKGLVELSVSAN